MTGYRDNETGVFGTEMTAAYLPAEPASPYSDTDDVDDCPACGEPYDERKLSASHALSVSHDPPSNALTKTCVVMPDSTDALVVYLHRDV